MYSHYVIVLDWATEDDASIDIVGVFHTLDDAKEKFEKYVIEEKQLARDNGYVINEENGVMFDAGIMGCWRDNHTTLYIQGVN
jgi:hypothetical protein